MAKYSENTKENPLKQLELYKIEETYKQWATKLGEANLAMPEFQNQVVKLEGLISNLFTDIPIRQIIVDNLNCTFRYSFNYDIVFVDLWKKSNNNSTNKNIVRTLTLPVFIYNYCNPMGAYVLELLIFERT